MFQVQQQIGPYTLVRLLGRGGFGEVWLAEKPGSLLTPQVALKLPLDPDPDLVAVQREARVWLQASGHPNVLPVIDAEIYNGQVVIVSEYAAGGSLSAWLKQHGGKAPSVEAAVAMTVGILAGLEYLHALKPEAIIHRDLKPDNVLLQGGFPRLTDFGISRVLKTTAQTQNASGTPHYMPPEAFSGKYSSRSDIWAAGVMLYQMLSGALPFPQADMPSLYGAILSGTPSPLPGGVPPEIKAVVSRALSKDPAQRFPSAAEMHLALKRVPAPAVVAVPPVIPPAPEPDKAKLAEAEARAGTLSGFLGLMGGTALAVWRAFTIYTVDVPRVGLLVAITTEFMSLFLCFLIGGIAGVAAGTGIYYLRNNRK